MLLLGLFLSLTACAHLDRAVKAPDVVLTTIELSHLSLREQRFQVALQVSNDNDFPLNIRELSYDLSLEGVQLTQGVFDQGVDLPAGGEETVTLQLTTDLIQTGRGLLNWLSQPQDHIQYRIEGKIQPRSAWMGEIPYRHSGRVEFRQ